MKTLHLSLIYGILIAQKLDIVIPIDILGHPTSELRINHNLYEGCHLRDVLFGKKLALLEGKLKGKILKTTLEFGLAIASTNQPLTSKLKKPIINLEGTIQSYENLLGHIYEQ